MVKREKIGLRQKEQLENLLYSFVTFVWSVHLFVLAFPASHYGY